MKDRVSVILRNEDAVEFEQLKEKMPSDTTNVAFVKKLMSFYKANSPYLKEVGGE